MLLFRCRVETKWERVDGTCTPVMSKNRQCVWSGMAVRFALICANIYTLMNSLTPTAKWYLSMLRVLFKHSLRVNPWLWMINHCFFSFFLLGRDVIACTVLYPNKTQHKVRALKGEVITKIAHFLFSGLTIICAVQKLLYQNIIPFRGFWVIKCSRVEALKTHKHCCIFPRVTLVLLSTDTWLWVILRIDAV